MDLDALHPLWRDIQTSNGEISAIERRSSTTEVIDRAYSLQRRARSCWKRFLLLYCAFNEEASSLLSWAIPRLQSSGETRILPFPA